MANVTIANTSANVSSKTLLTAENSYTVSGLLTFNRAPSAPFAVQAASAVVANLDANFLQGQPGGFYTNIANMSGTTLPASIVNSSLTAVGNISTGTWSGLFGAVSGANLTNLTAANLAGSSLPGSITGSGLTSVGTVTAGTWSSGFGAVSGANLTNITAANVTGSHTLPDGVLSTNVPVFVANVISFNSKWGINAAGDFTFGGTPHIAMSAGTPSTSGGGFGSTGTINGTDYAFVIQAAGSGLSSIGTVLFGHSFSNAPICNANPDNASSTVGLAVTTATTQMSIITLNGSNFVSSQKIYVQCTGY